MFVKSTDFQNNVGKYLKLASGQEIVITRKGVPVARLVGMNENGSFLSDHLVGLVPPDVDSQEIKRERLSKQ